MNIHLKTYWYPLIKNSLVIIICAYLLFNITLEIQWNYNILIQLGLPVKYCKIAQ